MDFNENIQERKLSQIRRRWFELKKNNNFFTADENEPDSMLGDTADSGGAAFKGSDIPTSEYARSGSGQLKKQLLLIGAIAVLLSAVLLAVRYYYHTEAIKGTQYYPSSWTENVKPGREPVLKFYPPDWETDIMTVPEYLELISNILYSPDDSQTIAVPEGQYLSMGGKGLNFMAEYINTVKAGDHEKLNSMFTDKYFEDNPRYNDFPQQKIFDVKIKKYPYHDQSYESKGIVDEYYVITYKIYHNDGLFRNDIDEESELAQLFEILIYDDGSVIIDNVIDLPGYFN